MEQGRGEHGAGVSGGDDGVRIVRRPRRGRRRRASCRASPGPPRPASRAWRSCLRLPRAKALRVEAGRAVEDRLDRACDAASSAPATISSGASVAAHGVDRDTNGRSHFSLRRRSAERLDFAAPVRLAGGAHAVRQLGLVADRALVDAGRLEAMLGPPLVAAGLVCLRLGTAIGPRSIATGRNGPGPRARDSRKVLGTFRDLDHASRRTTPIRYLPSPRSMVPWPPNVRPRV